MCTINGMTFRAPPYICQQQSTFSIDFGKENERIRQKYLYNVAGCQQTEFYGCY